MAPAAVLGAAFGFGAQRIVQDMVNLCVEARTLPGKQFEVSRQLRAFIVSGSRGSGVANAEAAASRT